MFVNYNRTWVHTLNINKNKRRILFMVMLITLLNIFLVKSNAEIIVFYITKYFFN